jgi:hypothetical protein
MTTLTIGQKVRYQGQHYIGEVLSIYKTLDQAVIQFDGFDYEEIIDCCYLEVIS